MSISGHVAALIREIRSRSVRWILGHRMRARHRTLKCDPTAIWDYGFKDIDAISIGDQVTVGAFAEIIVRRRGPYSSIAGHLVLSDRSVVSTGVNIRAAGGEIHVGKGSGIGQHCVLVAANHTIQPDEPRFSTPWDESRCHVFIGDNVWIGAGCVLLPGCKIGDNAIVAAGSVVSGEVPAGELWGGVPARKIKNLENAGR